MHKTHNSNKTILITCIFILVFTLFLFYTCLYFLKPILILELFMEIPFRPGFGENPYILIGRSSIIDRYSDILENNDKTLMKHPLIVGTRAIGKTVLLHRLLEIAHDYGYATVYESTQSDLYSQLMADLSDMSFIVKTSTNFAINPNISFSIPAPDGKTSTLTMSGIKFERSSDKQFFDRNLAKTICALLSSKKVRGVAIAIDEINIKYIDDIRKIATTMQTLISNGFPVSFIGAGLPEYIDEIKQDASISFIRRMGQEDIGNLSLFDVARAIETTCKENGISFDDNVGIEIAKASDGSPFIAQLFAYGACFRARQRNKNKLHITLDDCYSGFEDCLPQVFSALVKPTFSTLSEQEKKFIEAMSQLYPQSKVKIGDIIERTGKTKQYINIYKNRLIDKRIIKSDGHGYVKCIIPYMTMYLHNDEEAKNINRYDLSEMDNEPSDWYSKRQKD